MSSLQEQARRRAEALRSKQRMPIYDDSDSDEDRDALFAAANSLDTPSSVNTPAGAAYAWSPRYGEPAKEPARNLHHPSHSSNPPFTSQYTVKGSDTLSTTSPSSSPDSAVSSPPLNPHPGVPHAASTFTSPSTQQSSNMAAQARRDWQNHGTGLTQALEDVRLYNHHHHQMPRVRVFASASKVDAAGQDYTAYLIRVEQPNSPEEASIVEHRFSDFYKLQQQLEGLSIPVVFPSRMTLSGRLGNWTPSRMLAPDQHQSLIQYRLKQLDAWLVHVVQMTPMLNSQLQEHVHQFLQAETILPCQQPLRMQTQPASFSVKSATQTLNWINPVTFTMGSALRQACRSVESLCDLPTKPEGGLSGSQQFASIPEADHKIPLDLLRIARGILFVTVIKAGWVISGRVGTGLLIQRLNAPDSAETAKWSAPTAVGTFGMGWGLLAGADVTHYMVIFTTDAAVRDLVQQSTTVQVGAELSAAMGPLGRSANSHLQTGDWTLHTAYAYAHSQGLFVGVSLEGSLWQVRHDVNAKYYGQNTDPVHLLHQHGPPGAQPLYDRLNLALAQNAEDN